MGGSWSKWSMAAMVRRVIQMKKTRIGESLSPEK
jgi:hypothetical protein